MIRPGDEQKLRAKCEEYGIPYTGAREAVMAISEKSGVADFDVLGGGGYGIDNFLMAVGLIEKHMPKAYENLEQRRKNQKEQAAEQSVSKIK